MPPNAHSSVSSRWWGVTSEVTFALPAALACRSSAMVPSVLMWARCSLPPVSAASSMSRATIVSSAAAGCPGRPSRLATQPSCRTPSLASDGSSQWLMTGRPVIVL